MVSMITSSAINCEFDSRSDQTKDYTIGICCFSAKHTVLATILLKNYSFGIKQQLLTHYWLDYTQTAKVKSCKV
jgi:hypothetical protein